MASDITYIRMPSGWCYLTVIMDWYSRKVLSWRLSDTLDSGFCVEALQEANIRISTNGRGRALDNIMVERLRKTVKYEEVCLKSYDDRVEAGRELKEYMNWHNEERRRSSLRKRTPDDVYFSRENETDEAA